MSGKVVSVRFCTYGEMGVKSPLRKLRGVHRYGANHNVKLINLLRERDITNVAADKSASRKLQALNVDALFKGKNTIISTDQMISDIAMHIRGYAVLFYSRSLRGPRSVIFVADSDNIRALRPLNGGKRLVSFNSPFQPDLVNDDVEINITVTVSQSQGRRSGHGQREMTNVELELWNDFLRKLEIPVPED